MSLLVVLGIRLAALWISISICCRLVSVSHVECFSTSCV